MSQAGSISVNASGVIINPSSGGTGVANPPAHTVPIAEGSAPFNFVGPGLAGQVLQSSGAGVDPAFSTATFPGTATLAGTILRADGTNWSATTATYPNTTTANQILYSSATNTVSGLTSGNNLLAATNSSGTLAMRAFSINRQVFTSSGTYTPSTGMLYCDIEVVGGGGGGGGGATTGATTVTDAGGGGAGGYARGRFSAATIGASQGVVVGAAGTGGSGATPGVNGTSTTVGALIAASGGIGGTGSNAAAANASAGGAGGVGSGGDFQTTGNPGSDGWGSNAAGLVAGGNGGSSFFGGGGRVSIVGGGAAPGGNATSFGGGGAGGANFTSQGATVAGGNGAKGVVIITEYIIN